MITPELVKTQEAKKSAVQCAVCKNGAGSKVKIVRLGTSFSVVCEECIVNFSKEDLELMHNMFVAFGGWFGKCASSKEDSFQELKIIAKEYAKSGKDIAKIESDVKTLHRAFLHGITLVQLVQGLRVLSE
jgi:hypothetical protein